MATEIMEKERVRTAALAFAIDHARGRINRQASDIVEDAEKYHAFLVKQA